MLLHHNWKLWKPKFKMFMDIVSNPSDEIPPKKTWEFQSKSGRLNYFIIYIT